MALLDGVGLKWLVSLIKNYIGSPWSMGGDVSDTLILANADLDNYTVIGNYYCRPSSDATSVKNNPSTTSFILKVYSGDGRSASVSGGNYLTQHVEDIYGNVWSRYKTTGAWSDWKKVATFAASGDIGSDSGVLYIKDGELVASTATVGDTATPVYLNKGDITALSDTVGGTALPVYLKGGTVTALSATVGSGIKPTYLKSGTVTASDSTVGSGARPLYMSSGELKVTDTALTDYLLLTGGTVTGTIDVGTLSHSSGVSVNGIKITSDGHIVLTNGVEIY